MQSFIINLEITQHLKAGNVEIAKSLIDKLSQEDKDRIIKSCKFLLRTNYIHIDDRNTLQTKLKLMQNEI